MFKAVILDMDGTMFDTERLCVEGWQFAGREMRIRMSDELLGQTLGIPIEQVEALFYKTFGSAFDYSRARALQTEYIYSYIDTHGIPVKQGLYQLLSDLQSSGYPIAIATATRWDRVRRYLEKARLPEAVFCVIVTGDMVEHRKPAPDAFLMASERLGIGPGECLAIEDSPAGVRASTAAGIKVALVPGIQPPDKETMGMAYACIPSLEHVMDLLREENDSASQRRTRPYDLLE